ncbi:Phage integrase family protein [Roseivivax lentus]|uniref:Phage integrase family protein n=1 Tax=Roseivivax lentus TaxID=633194 RepID=A0A1N7P3Z5_9RHOB|nr:tyrosine-type recombinase/integrase [Roseivivax lentus]SIT05311.1 Phage integrase family protein [Roseivivax lentus]
MTLQQEIRDYLARSDIKMRALALQAGLNPRAVQDILDLPGIRPDRRTLDALGEVMGVHLPTPVKQMTYARLIADLSRMTEDGKADRRNRVLASRVRKFLETAGWVAETEIVDRRRAVEKLATWSAATLGVSQGSFNTYKSDILTAISCHGGRNRPTGIRDVSGLYREIHDLITKSVFPDDLKLISGAFLTYLDQQAIQPADITTDVLKEYYLYRLAVSPKCEAKCKKHVMRISALCTRLASDPAFASFGFEEVAHPFPDGRNKHGVEADLFFGVLSEFDGSVSRWLKGETSRDGLSQEDFLTQLDAAEVMTPANPKKALLKKSTGGRRRSEEERQSAGFLLPNETWSEKTIKNRRYQLIAGAKALYAARGYLIEDLTEYTDPDVVENVLDALSSGNSDDEFPSGYVETVGKTLKKLARDYVGRSADDVNAIADHIKEHAIGEAGISRRNKARLRQIIGDRQQCLIDLSDILIGEVNSTLAAKARKRPGVTRADALGAEEVRDIMCAVASDILLARAPRRANVTGIRLSWISWMGSTARIVVPNIEVKGRDSDDPDLHIPLDEYGSGRLKVFLDKARPKALRLGDEDNPYLFPAQGDRSTKQQPYSGLLERLSRHTKRLVGLKMNPHLYRHFLGWLWLKEDPDRLPDVQRLLGHKRLETTLAHYAEIDEDLALDRWSKYLADRKSRERKSGKKTRKTE